MACSSLKSFSPPSPSTDACDMRQRAAAALRSSEENSLFRQWGMPALSYPEVRTFHESWHAHAADVLSLLCWCVQACSRALLQFPHTVVSRSHLVRPSCGVRLPPPVPPHRRARDQAHMRKPHSASCPRTPLPVSAELKAACSARTRLPRAESKVQVRLGYDIHNEYTRPASPAAPIP